MAKARFIKTTSFCAILFVVQKTIAASAWLPKPSEYLVGISASEVTSYSKDTQIEVNKYAELEAKIAELYLVRSNLIENNSKLAYVTNQRVEIIDDKIASIRRRQEEIAKDFVKTSQNYYLERGIDLNNSMGFSANASSSMNFNGSSKRFLDLEIFGKRRLYESKKWIFSAEYGFKILDSHNNNIYPMIRVNGAYVKTTKAARKLITEVDIATIAVGHNYIESNVRQTLEFRSGYMLQLGTYYSYKENYNLGYRYFWRDQFIVAKKLSSDIIPIPGMDAISIGLYQDYFHKKRKQAGKGIFCGVWFRI